MGWAILDDRFELYVLCLVEITRTFISNNDHVYTIARQVRPGNDHRGTSPKKTLELVYEQTTNNDEKDKVRETRRKAKTT